jgi:Probable lipoprotein LpqN
MRTASRAVAAVLAAMAMVLATSCTRTIDDARVVAAADMGKAPSDGSECTSVDTPLTTIPDRGDDEPILKIPQPEGWQRVTMMDSELIRFAMRNTSLEKDGLAPTAVVTLESQPEIADPQVVFDAQHTALESGLGATDLRVRQHTLCGLPAETIDYTAPTMGLLPSHPATSVCAVLHTEDSTFAVSVTVQSTQADNPIFQRDAEMILTGFQMLPPSDQ